LLPLKFLGASEGSCLVRACLERLKNEPAEPRLVVGIDDGESYRFRESMKAKRGCVLQR
jgi:hypothetical protein